jgi:hypothetical protein
MCVSRDAFSAAYRKGFLKGYADYLYYGGKGEPPPVPPLCYLLLHDQNPPGHAEAQDWFAGFRHGAAEARNSGRREFIEVPLSIPYSGDIYRRRYSGPPPDRERPAERLPLPAEELPPPRSVPNGGLPDHGRAPAGGATDFATFSFVPRQTPAAFPLFIGPELTRPR